jgi:adenosylcobinamide-GDP ribazoletransferase
VSASALWLTFGTFTALPVPAPSTIDKRTAGMAMVLAPAAGALLAVAPAGVLAFGDWRDVPSLLPSAVAIAVLAWSTRGLHLDGLADTADGLAASYDRIRALEVMRRGDTGPAGTATLVLVLLVQAAALAAAVDRGRGVFAIVVAVVAARAVVSLACVRGIRAARPVGLGATVAESVPVPAAAAVAMVTLLAATVWSPQWWVGPLAVAAAYLAAALLLRRCVRRLGGVTGDVIGGCVEAATTAAVIVVALV